MTVTAQAEAAILAPVSRITRRLEICESDGTTTWLTSDARRIIDGSVTVQYGNDVRRNLDITLDNRDGALDSDPDGFWYDKVIKVYRGVEWPGGSWETQLGEFIPDRISKANFPHSTKVTARDYVKKGDSELASATSFKSGLALETVIGAVAANAGITKLMLPVTNKLLAIDTPFDAGTKRSEIWFKLADSFGMELYFDLNGYMTMREYQDPVSSPTIMTFKTGPEGNLASYEKSTNDAKVKNHIIVRGESSDSSVTPIVAEAINTEPTSPTRVSRIGDRTMPYSSPLITTQAQANLIAAQLLKVNALESYELSFESIVFPWLDVGGIVEFVDPDPFTPSQPTRFLLDSLTIPLTLGAMSGTGKRITPITDDGISSPEVQVTTPSSDGQTTTVQRPGVRVWGEVGQTGQPQWGDNSQQTGGLFF